MSVTGGPKRVIILGALSAIGEMTARLYAGEGAHLLLAGRNAERLESVASDLKARGAGRCLGWPIDLAKIADPFQTFQEMVDALGGADDVLLFYGVLGDQERAERDVAEARTIIKVNFSSAAEWSLAAAGHLEAQGHGALVVVSSVAGDRGRRSNYVYGASKGALTLLVQGIAHRLAPSAARAVVMKLGYVDTPMTDGFAKRGLLWASPEQVALSIRRAAEGRQPMVYAPWFWRWIMLLVRSVPAWIFHRTKL